MTKKIDAKSWSYMWENPSITTFGHGDFTENYDGPILEFWESQLTGEFDHVVDVACGNGALCWIANDLLNGGERKTAIAGVDFADITPFKTLDRKQEDYPAISFIGNNPIEKLPFESASVDFVISQYGVEYSDLDQSIPEIARVLGPTGKMSFILHDRDGDLVRASNQPLKEYKKMLDVFRLDELILQLGKIHEKKQPTKVLAQSEQYRQLVDKIESLSAVFQSLTAKLPDDATLLNYKSRLEYALGEATKKSAKRQCDLGKFIADARGFLQLAIDRKEDLNASALGKQELKDLIALIKKEGFTITEKRTLIRKESVDPATMNKKLKWGTMLVAERAPGGGLFGYLRRLFGRLVRR